MLFIINANGSIVGNQTVLPVNPTVNGSFVGQITVSSSSVNTSGSNFTVTNLGGFMFKPHPNNTVTVWVVNTGGTPSNGFPINSTDSGMLFTGSALSSLDYGITGTGSAVLCWSRL